MIIDESKFPFEQLRPQQVEVIETINNSAPDKRYFILNCATGAGKSPLGIAACLTSPTKGFYITRTKQLQDQLEHDFSGLSFTSIKGKANYTCTVNNSKNCEHGQCFFRKKIKGQCLQDNKCTYYNLKKQADESTIMATSYKYFFRTLDHKKNKSNEKERGICVFDEAHNLENELIDFAQFTLDTQILFGKYDLLAESSGADQVALQVFLTQKDTPQQTVAWLQLAANAIIKRWKSLGEQLNQLTEHGASEDDLKKASNDFSEFDRLYTKIINWVRHKHENWIYEVKGTELKVIPLGVNWIFNTFIEPSAEQFIFMSATLFDPKVFARTIGLPESKVEYIRTSSVFDPKKSPVHILAHCKTNYEALQDNKNLDTIVDTVQDVLKLFPNSKGLIHSGNFNITKYLRTKIKDSRMLYRYERDTNDVILEQHKFLKAPTVLVSSSMTEGVDLPEDLSRFQIIIKLPWLSLADKRTKVMADLDSDWYQLQLWNSFIQACGRSTRSETDTSQTFVLDSSFWFFYKQAKDKGWIPDYFADRIHKM